MVENVLTLEDIKKRLITITSNDEVKDIDSFWKASFEVGVDPSHLKDDAFPNCGDENLSRELDLTLIHSQRRYDFGFSTPSCMSTYLFFINDISLKTMSSPFLATSKQGLV